MDIQHTMEFILEQQAHFASEFDKIHAALLELAERQRTTEEVLSRLAQNQVTMQQAIVEVANTQERTNEIMATLAERQIATEETSRGLEEAMRQLVERQQTTEGNLNALILTVDRHIANHK